MRAALLVSLLAATGAAAAPLRPERIVIRTEAGDLAVALHERAPRHAAKLLKLFASGAYDGTPLAKLDASRFAAFSSAPRAPGAKRLPVESGGPAAAGAVVMAHQPDDPDPGETAFVILFAALPAMDGRFSVVGEIAGPREVFEALKTAPVDAASKPKFPLTITGTEVLASPQALERANLRGPVGKALGRDEEAARRFAFFLMAAVFGLAAGALALFAPDLGEAAWSGALLCVLAAFFCLFAVYAPRAAGSPWISVPLFAATVAVFRLMAAFER